MTIGRIIKSELKKCFPHVKFSVTSDYSSVRINWLNGVTTAQVNEITSKYKRGDFDGMTDRYEYSNIRQDVPQIDYVFLNRDISENVYQEKFEEYKNYYAGWEKVTDIDDFSNFPMGGSPRSFIRRKLSDICL